MGMPFAIRRERPDTGEASRLIAELEAALAPHYPVESRHGYSVEKLLREDVHFFVLRAGPLPAACGGIQFYADFGELKRMFVRPQFRGRGFGRAVLVQLEAHARAQGRDVIRLKTGIHQHDAIRLYDRGGFVRIPPFAPYSEDPLSLFFEKTLAREAT